MHNLLKHEFFKFFKSYGFKLMFLIVIWAAILICAMMLLLINMIPEEEEIMAAVYVINGTYAVISAFADFSNISIIIAVIVSMTVIREFQEGTIKNTLMHNQTRLNIYISKYLLQIMAITVTLTAYVLVHVVFYNIYGKWGQTFTFASLWNNNIKIYLMSMLLCYAIAAFINFFAYLSKNTAVIIVAIIILTTILSLLTVFKADLPPFLQFFSNVTFSAVVMNYFLKSSAINLIYYFISTALLFFPFFAGGYLLFNRQEVK